MTWNVETRTSKQEGLEKRHKRYKLKDLKYNMQGANKGEKDKKIKNDI